MAGITIWLQSWREDREQPLTPEAAEQLGTALYHTLARRLRPMVTARFGIPTPEEMASEQVADLLQRLDEGTLALPGFVVSSRTLLVWMYWTARWRFLRRLGRRKSRPPERGLSEASLLRGGACDPLGLQGVEARAYRGDVLAVGELGVEEVEALEAGLSDCRRWHAAEAGAAAGGGWADAFERVVFAGRRQGEVAAELGVADGTLSRWLDRPRFCIARRMGYTAEQLDREFGGPLAARWTHSLEAALGRNP